VFLFLDKEKTDKVEHCWRENLYVCLTLRWK